MATQSIYEFGDFRLDPARRSLQRGGGESVALGAKAFEALVHLVEHAGEPVARRALTEALWPDTVVEENNLSQAISALRRKLGTGHIVTLPGRGYQFVSEVRKLERDPRSQDSGAASHELPRSILPAPSSAIGADTVADPLSAGSSGAAAESSAFEALTRRSAAEPSPDSRRRFQSFARLVVGLAVVAAATIGAWAYLYAPQRDEEPRIAAVHDAAEAPTRLAVLPFDDQSADPEQRYFADGLTDELIINLQRLAGLRVTGRTTAFAFRDSELAVEEIADELDVDYVVEGSVAREGDRLRVRVQLSDAAGFGVWPYSYDGTMQSLFDVQEEIVRGVAEGLRTRLGVAAALPHARTDSIEAYELYVTVREKIVQGAIDAEQGIELLERALEIDPQYATVRAHKAMLHIGAVPFIANAEGRERAVVAANEAVSRAIDLDPMLGDAYAARAYIESERGNWAGAERDYARARSLGFVLEEPSAYGPLLVATGRLEEALAYLERALMMDRMHPGAMSFLMEVHEQLGDREAADDTYRRYELLYGTDGFGPAFRRWILLGRGDAEAIREAHRLRSVEPIARIAELVGEPERALEILHAEATDPENMRPANAATLAMWAAYFGETETALRLLEHSVADAALLTHLAWLPVFEEVRRLPAFKDLLVDIGLVEFWRVNGWADVCWPTEGDDFRCI